MEGIDPSIAERLEAATRHARETVAEAHRLKLQARGIVASSKRLKEILNGSEDSIEDDSLGR